MRNENFWETNTLKKYIVNVMDKLDNLYRDFLHKY